MELFKFTVTLTKVKGMAMAHNCDVYVSSESMSDAIAIIEKEFYEDDFEVSESCKVKGKYIKGES